MNFRRRFPGSRRKLKKINPCRISESYSRIIWYMNQIDPCHSFRVIACPAGDREKKGEMFEPSPLIPKLSLGGWNFAWTRAPQRPVDDKKISAPAPLTEEIWGDKHFSPPRAPSKSLRQIRPKFCRWLALEAPDKRWRFGARAVHSFLARHFGRVLSRSLRRSRILSLLHIKTVNRAWKQSESQDATENKRNVGPSANIIRTAAVCTITIELHIQGDYSPDTLKFPDISLTMRGTHAHVKWYS